MRMEALTVKKNHRTKGSYCSLFLWGTEIGMGLGEVRKLSEVVSEHLFTPSLPSGTG